MYTITELEKRKILEYLDTINDFWAGGLSDLAESISIAGLDHKYDAADIALDKLRHLLIYDILR